MLHIWNKTLCRWMPWHGTRAAWRQLPHAVIGLGCSLAGAGLLPLSSMPHYPIVTPGAPAIKPVVSGIVPAFTPFIFPGGGSGSGFTAGILAGSTPDTPSDPTPATFSPPAIFTLPPTLVPPNIITPPLPDTPLPPLTITPLPPPTQVPEPGSALLLATALTAFGALCLRRPVKPKGG